MIKIKHYLVFALFHISRKLLSPIRLCLVQLKLFLSRNTEVKSHQLFSLHRHGLVVIPNFFTKEYCESVISGYDEHELANSNILESDSDFRLIHAEVVIKQLDIFFDHTFLNKIATSYIGFPTWNSACLVNRVPPMSGDFGSGGSWHRDANFPQFKALVYLSEVYDTNDGAFQYIPRSNRILSILKDTFLLGRRISATRWSENEVQQRYSTDSIKSVLGSPGMLVLFDTSLLHRGAANLNSSKSRYAMTNYYYPKFGSIGQYL